MSQALSPKTLRQRRRDQQAISLRLGGASYPQIAEQSKGWEMSYVDAGHARKMIIGELRKLGAPDADELRELELVRLDRLQMRWWAVVFSDQAGHNERRDATDKVLSIMKRRADLCGLDAPKKLDVRMLVSYLTEKIDLMPLPRARAVVRILTEDGEETEQAVALLTAGIAS